VEAGPCKGCQLGKAHQCAFPPSSKRSDCVLGLIHTDLCEFPILSRSHAKWMITFIDDASGFSALHFLRSKADAVTALQSLKQCDNMLAYHHLFGKMLLRPLSTSITDNLCVDLTGPPPSSNGMVKNQMYLISRSLGLKPTSSFLKRNDNTNCLLKQKRLSSLGMKKEPKATDFGLQSVDVLSSLLPPLSTSLPFLSVPKREKTNHPQHLFHIPAITTRSPLTCQIIRTRLCRTESRKTF
jgi:hypothetical protein